MVSIEIISFGDWKCCKAYFFFFSNIVVCFYWSTVSGPFACSLPQQEDSTMSQLSSQHQSGALSTAWLHFLAPEGRGRQGCQTPGNGSTEHPTALELAWNMYKYLLLCLMFHSFAPYSTSLPSVNIQRPPTSLLENETTAAELLEVGKWGKRHQHVVLSVAAWSWGMKSFPEQS